MSVHARALCVLGPVAHRECSRSGDETPNALESSLAPERCRRAIADAWATVYRGRLRDTHSTQAAKPRSRSAEETHEAQSNGRAHHHRRVRERYFGAIAASARSCKYSFRRDATVLVTTFFEPASIADLSVSVPGADSAWHNYKRHDFRYPKIS